jgi:hypothetical protein
VIDDILDEASSGFMGAFSVRVFCRHITIFL